MAGDTVIKNGKATITITGLSALYATLRKVSPRAQEVGVDVLNRGAGRVFAVSQESVPVGGIDPKGELKASGRLYKARVSKRSGRVYATITYGGARLESKGEHAIVAIVQHENLSFKHSHGGPKFLERPFLAEKEHVMDDLGRRIMEAISHA